MNRPKISIVTPSFNQVEYLSETIESILNQGYPELEYSIIDGGSTDGSVEIIKKYESRLSYWISEKDDGQSDAIMKGFARSTGELFAWVNSDDVLFPGCLKKIAAAYVKCEKSDIIHSNIAYIDSKSRIVRFVRIPAQSRFFSCRGVWYAQAPAVFFKSQLFHSIGGLNKNYHLSMDFDIWVRMMKFGAKVVHLPHYLGGFRWHEASKTVNYLDQSKSRENPEAQEICRLYIPNVSKLQRLFWKYILKGYRMLIMNYLLAYKDYANIRGHRRWQDVFIEPSTLIVDGVKKNASGNFGI